MRTISKSSQFKSDFKKMLRVPRYRDFTSSLQTVVDSLILGEPLAAKVHDHPLQGSWIGCRECHLQPDLLLVYLIESEDKVTLMRLGTHSELFR
jgi:mRNA interferase YafQ